MKHLTLLLMIGAAAMASAQGKVFIRFPDAGPREVWVQPGLPSDPPTTGVKTEASSVELPIGNARPADAVFVWDKRSGNLASRTVKDVQADGTWMVDGGAYLDVADVVVKVQSDGKPVAAANVSLDDGRRVRRVLLDPSSQGEVHFFAVKPGSLKVTVEYKSGGKSAAPVKQLLDAPLKRSDGVPTLMVALPEPVTAAPAPGNVTPSTSQDAPASAGASRDPGSGSPFGAIIGYIVALGLAIGVGFVLFRYMKQNPDSVGAKLEQLGVQIPKPGDDPLTSADPVPAPTPIQPQPPQKIMLDDAASEPLVSAPAAIPAQATGVIRLVAANGDELPLDEGLLTVGREVGLGLSLVSESTVSRRHAEITRSGSSVRVRDLGSTNGTFVNGTRLTGDVDLLPGDLVQFGEARFRLEA